jgi:hypothetical protein
VEVPKELESQAKSPWHSAIPLSLLGECTYSQYALFLFVDNKAGPRLASVIAAC